MYRLNEAAGRAFGGEPDFSPQTCSKCSYVPPPRPYILNKFAAKTDLALMAQDQWVRTLKKNPDESVSEFRFADNRGAIAKAHHLDRCWVGVGSAFDYSAG